MKLRPHHGLCIILFAEEGHSAAYASNMREYVDTLDENPHTKVILCRELDGICGYCPHNSVGAKSAPSVCEKSDEVDVSDGNILAYCGLEYGEELSWEDLRRKLIDNVISKDLLKDACRGCTYLTRCENNPR